MRDSTPQPEIKRRKVTAEPPVWALGVMSGTSLDGIDLALLHTDGREHVAFGPWMSRPLAPRLQSDLRGLMHGVGDALAIERSYSEAVAACIRDWLATAADVPDEVTVAVLGFHGQTLAHRPAEGLTWQLGNPALVAARTGLPVVADFRRADMAAGGQGAPLAPLYHAALVQASALAMPVAVVNIGGVANLTYIDGDTIIAFDTGPGNAALNDWVQAHGLGPYDEGGALAAAGTPDAELVEAMLRLEAITAPPPKALDRDIVALSALNYLKPEDGAATLTAITARAIAGSVCHLPKPPARWLLCGGGRHNATLCRAIAEALMVPVPVEPVEAVGWRGDALEAEAFAYLAVRSLLMLPLSLPTTTGVTAPATGGAFSLPPGAFP